MGKKSRTEQKRASALSRGWDFLENPAEPEQHVAESVTVTESPTVPEDTEEIRAEPVLRYSPDTLEAGTGKFSSHYRAFGTGTRVYVLEPGELCPHCKYDTLQPVISFSGKECEFWVYCPNCNAYICTYKPMAHQVAFHEDVHTQKLYAGGFGSAKTYTCGMEFLATVLQIPNSAGLIGARTWGQVADTCLKFITENLPEKLVANSHQDKVSWYIDLINGSRISAKAFDKEGKIRSANLSIIWIEEASEVDYEIFAYLLARLRNKVGYFRGRNRLKCLLSSNPDVGWLNTEFLMHSSVIQYHGEVKDRYKVPNEDKDPAKSTHISATSANIYLPPDYEANLARNKEQWWVNRYLKGSFKYTEGLVYPEFSDWFIPPFQIPPHWKRCTGTDFGRRDPTAHLVAALDPVGKVIYVYAELEESLDDRDLDWIATQIKKTDDFPESLLAFPHQADPRGRNRDQVSGQSWFDAYRSRGIIFQPAQDCEANSIAPTILKVATYAKHGRLKFFDTCKKLKSAFAKYKYPERKIGDDKNQGESPMDKHNHLPDALRYLMSPFPQFPESPDDFSSVWLDTMRENQITAKKAQSLGFYDEPNDGYVGSFMDNFG